MKDYGSILRRCGWALIAIGLIDIAVMAWCVASQTSYGSSLNVFAVIAGFFLLKGSLKAARIISSYIAFLIAGLIGGFLIMPFLFPVDLIVIYWKSEPRLPATLAAIAGGLAVALLLWIYRELTSLPVRVAMDQAQIDYTSLRRRPAAGFLVGSSLIMISFIILFSFMHGKTAQLAMQKAELQLGPGYRYHVRSFCTSSAGGRKRIEAAVTAYRNSVIKEIVVVWTE